MATSTPILDVESTQLPIEWRNWLAENRVIGVAGDVLCEAMVREGFDATQVRTELAAIDASPLFVAGDWVAQRLRKLESLLSIRQQMAALAPPREIPRRSGVQSEEFCQTYYAANEPVLLTDVGTDWVASREWDPDYLARVLGEEEVEIVSDRDSDARYELNAITHKRMIRFSEYVRVVIAGRSNDSYLVANNHLLERPAAAPLLRDFACDARYLTPAPAPGSAFLWFGPAGTITPLHHDTSNVLFAQVHGRKRFTLISPLESPWLYNDVAVYSQVDLNEPDLATYPLFAQARPITLVVEPGETLFIPVGWWHHVEALDVSISLSFTNFRWPNTFEWAHPSIVR
jgi:Cupin-like domain